MRDRALGSIKDKFSAIRRRYDTDPTDLTEQNNRDIGLWTSYMAGRLEENDDRFTAKNAKGAKLL